MAVGAAQMVFSKIEHKGRVLRATPPLELNPTLDEESQQVYVVTDDSLDIHVFAYTREELAGELAEYIFCAWDNYAKEDPEKLGPKARELRAALRDRFQEGA